MIALRPALSLSLLLLSFFLLCSPSRAGAQDCPPALLEGDVNQDGRLTPGDALRAFRHWLAIEPLETCEQTLANVFFPFSSEVSPADIQCILQRFLQIPSCLDPLIAHAGADLFVSPTAPPDTFPVVSLNGSQSAARHGETLHFRWNFTEVPEMSAVTDQALSEPDAVIATFTPDSVGQYLLSLTVSTALGRRAQDVTMVNVQAPAALMDEGCVCTGQAGEEVDMPTRLNDEAENPVPLWPVTYTLIRGDGFLLLDRATPTVARSSRIFQLTNQTASPCQVRARRTPDEPTAAACFTDAAGITTVPLVLGEAQVHVVTARAQDVPTPVYFCIGIADRDGDCVADDLEPLLGLDPDSVDTDNNGIPDGSEDFDGDQLSNVGELIVGTNPRAFDTDDDGLSDGASDIDADQLSNSEEISVTGTNPLVADTDGDGWPDGIEVETHSDPLDTTSQPHLLVIAPPILATLPGTGSREDFPDNVTVGQPPILTTLPGTGSSEGLAANVTVGQPPVMISFDVAP